MSQELTTQAHAGLVDSLQKFGNTLSPQHEQALFALVDSFTRMASGDLKGRWAFPIPTGCGKTRAVIEWATAVSKLKLPFSLVVSASRIEALCTMKRDMIKNGIPRDQIGLIYALSKEPYSEPATDDNESRPFLLCSHQMIRSRATNLDLYNTYQGEPRSLCIYDESLLVSDIEYFTVGDICGALAGQIHKYKYQDRDKGTNKHGDILNWMTERLQRIEYQYDHFDVGGTNELPSPVFVLAPETEQDYERVFRKAGHTLLADFLAANGLPFRMFKYGKAAVISYRVVIPEALENIIVLDASYPIRRLEQTDTTLHNAEDLPSCAGVTFDTLKRFDRVALYRMAKRGSRTSAVQDKTKMKHLMKDVVHVVKSIPRDEAILVFVYKEHSELAHPTKVLQAELRKAGLKTRKNLHIQTWGNETSLNCYANCAHVILVGILHRDLSELAGSMAGQSQDITVEVTRDELDGVCLSERVHCAYQALSRGTCRVMGEPGQAKAMTGYIVEFEDHLENELGKVMPGASWQVWKPVFSDAQEYGLQAKALTGRIETTLDDLLQEVPVGGKVSTQKLKARCQVKLCDHNLWNRSLNSVLEQKHQWKRNLQSTQRVA